MLKLENPNFERFHLHIKFADRYYPDDARQSQ